MIDLHTHTCHSDGADSVKTLMERTGTLGLSVLSITDHNSVNAYFDDAISSCPAKLIPGVEITCMYQGEVVEVLGYGFCIENMNEQLADYVLSFEDKQNREFELLTDAFKKAGLVFDRNAVSFDPKKESCRKAFLRCLKEHTENRKFFSCDESWESSRTFARKEVYNPESPLYVDESSLYPDVKTAVEMIHHSGGIAFLAHLYIYAHATEFRQSLRHIVTEFGLDGIECAHSAFTKAQREDLEHFCDEHSLLKSGGSDYHGNRKPDVELGVVCGGESVSEEYLEKWPLFI